MVTSEIKAIDDEPEEELLLVNAIKNAAPEKKAQRDFDKQMDEMFSDRPKSAIKRFKVKDGMRSTF